MRFPRFTIRRMMVLVAVVAIALAGSLFFIDTMVKRKAHYLRKARDCEMESWMAGVAADDPYPGAEAVAAVKEKRVRIGLKQRKYERAARYPWLPVAPDTPEPE